MQGFGRDGLMVPLDLPTLDEKSEPLKLKTLCGIDPFEHTAIHTLKQNTVI